MHLGKIADDMQNYLSQFPEIDLIPLEVQNDTHEHAFKHHHAKMVGEGFMDAINAMRNEPMESWSVLDHIDNGAFEKAVPKLHDLR